MAWKYVNPGYAELTTDGGTTVEDKKVCTLNGVKYTSAGDNRLVHLPVPVPQDLWIKVKYIRTNTRGQIYVRHDYNNNGVEFYGSKLTFKTDSNDTYITDDTVKVLTGEVIIHWHFSKTNGFIEVQINGKKFNSGICNVGNGIEAKTNTACSLYVKSESTGNYWYDIILADYDISDEEIATAKLTDLTGTWEGIEAGTAKATEVGQVLSQKIDTSDLNAQITAQTPMVNIKGVTIAGLKMEYDSSKIDRMTGIINDGSKDVFSEAKAVNSNFSMVCNSYQKDLSIDDIAKMTCSLKATKA